MVTRGDATARANRRMLLVPLLRAVAVTVIVFTLYFTLPFDKASEFNSAAALFIGLIAVATLLAWQARAITHDPHPRARAFEALTTSFPIAVLVFATTYFLMGQADPANFTQSLSRVDALYFTVVPFATVGFGDITPVSELARLTVTIQIIVDLILVGLVVRVFVQSVQRGLARRDETDSADE